MPHHYCVLFDVDDTLIEWRVSWQEAFAQVAGEAGVVVTPEQVRTELSAHLAEVYPECVARHAARGDMRAFWLDYDGRVLATIGVKENLPHYARRIVDILSDPDACRLYAEVPEVLETFAGRGAQLGIITGRPLADPDLERLGIIHHFAPILDAFKARSAKEQGRMFRLAAAAAEGRPAWHVGDSYHGDVLGARAAGLRPVLLDRTGSHNGVDCPRISDLRELLDLVG